MLGEAQDELNRQGEILDEADAEMDTVCSHCLFLPCLALGTAVLCRVRLLKWICVFVRVSPWDWVCVSLWPDVVTPSI